MNNNYHLLKSVGRLILVLMAVLMPGAAMAQDSCSSPVTITAGVHTVDIVDGQNIPNQCSNAASAEWFRYVPTQNYTVVVTSDLPSNICKDTHFSVFSGSCESLVCVAEDDDSGVLPCNTNGNSYLSTDSFEAIAGNVYYIVWDNRWSTAGFDFELIEMPYVPTPCAEAIPVSPGITHVDAVDGINQTTVCSSASAAKWYVYTAPETMNVTISSDLPQNACGDTFFAVYTGSCNGSLACVSNDDNSGEILCDGESKLSRKTFSVTAGVTYYIAWDNRWSSEGFDFSLSEHPIVNPVNFSTQNDATINSQYRMCIVDMNGDGKDDVVGVSLSNLRIHFQGDGGALTHQDFPVAGPNKMPTWSLAAGDYNADGYNDLLLGSGDGLTFWKSNGNGTGYTSVTPGQYIFCQRTNFIDINNDGHLDAFSCHDVDPNVYYMNDGTGEMTYFQSGVTPGAYNLGILPSGGNYASIWTDFDNDGDTDMFISKCSGPACELHRNDGPAGYTDISVAAQINFQPVQSWSSAIADFDNDGDMDILVGTNGNVSSRLFRNNLDTSNEADEPFTDVTMGSGWDTDNSSNRDYIAYDFDNDGFVDVMGGGNKIMFNNGDMTFSPAFYPGFSVGAVGDLNGDGFLDILNGSNIRYGVPNGNNWFKVGLTGVQSNTNGIGARVEIHGSWGVQIRDVRSGEGFGYMSTLNTHFGLGAATAIDQVVIKWPSGVVDTIMNPSPNQMLSVVEGSTLAVTDMVSGQFRIFPNPATDRINIRLQDDSQTVSAARIFDLSGRLIKSPEVINDGISVKELSAGTYLLVLESSSGMRNTMKFIKN